MMFSGALKAEEVAAGVGSSEDIQAVKAEPAEAAAVGSNGDVAAVKTEPAPAASAQEVQP